MGLASPQENSHQLDARKYNMQALAIDPKNPVALKNLGAILGREGDRSIPRTPQTVYGLAFAYMEMGDIEQAQKHFQMVLEI
jgi:tetratricopeptide (TPR) repeat protein